MYAVSEKYLLTVGSSSQFSEPRGTLETLDGAPIWKGPPEAAQIGARGHQQEAFPQPPPSGGHLLRTVVMPSIPHKVEFYLLF